MPEEGLGVGGGAGGARSAEAKKEGGKEAEAPVEPGAGRSLVT